MFAAEFEPLEKDNRRRSKRAPVSFDVSVGQGGIGRTLCRVVDLSLHGARLRSYSALRKGMTIWLTLPELGPVAADIMWADDFLAGCQFHQPLDKDVFERLSELQADE